MNQENEDHHIPLSDYEQNNAVEPIQDIINHRKKKEENRKKQLEADKLEAERKELELTLKIRREKERIEKAKNLLDGKVFCDDCQKWVYRSHFD